MAIYAYARPTVKDPRASLQTAALRAAGCESVHVEKKLKTDPDKVRRSVLESLADGDVLIVTRVACLSKSAEDLREVLSVLNGKNATLKALEQDFDTAELDAETLSKALVFFSEFQSDVRRESQLQGVEKAKKNGVYKGMPPRIDAEAVKRMKAVGFKEDDIAKKLGIGRASVFRILRKDRESESVGWGDSMLDRT